MAKFEDEAAPGLVLHNVRDIMLKLNSACDSCKGTGLTLVNSHDAVVGVLTVKVGVCRCVSMWVNK